EFVGVYGLLASIYIVGGVVAAKACRYRPRIQDRECPKGLIRRDFIQSLVSLASISAFFTAGIAFQAGGYGFAAPRSLLVEPISLIGSLLVFDTWFYWGHRLIHSRLLFTRVHAWHHTCRTPTVWSNNSDSFLDNCILQSYWMVAHFILPIGPY